MSSPEPSEPAKAIDAPDSRLGRRPPRPNRTLARGRFRAGSRNGRDVENR